MKQSLHTALLGLVAAAVLSACSDSTPPPAGPGLGDLYSGSKAAATIDAGNADSVTTMSLGGITTGSTAQSAAAAKPVAKAIAYANKGIAQKPAASPDYFAAAGDILFSVDGLCGGLLRITETSSGFDVLFSDYCDISGESLNGLLRVTGSGNAGTVTITGYHYTYTTLVDLEVNGSVSYAANTVDSALYPGIYTLETSGLMTMNLLIKDNILAKDTWIDNLVFGFTNNYDASEMLISVAETVSGRIYHTDLGYVDFSTPSALVTGAYDLYPGSGVLVLTGASGTSVTLTALDNTQYQMDIDIDGDGVSDSMSTGFWSSLSSSDFLLGSP